MKHLGYLPINRNSRLIMQKIILSLVALFGLMSYLSAQLEVGDGGSNFTEFELDDTMVFHGESTVSIAINTDSNKHLYTTFGAITPNTDQNGRNNKVKYKQNF